MRRSLRQPSRHWTSDDDAHRASRMTSTRRSFGGTAIVAATAVVVAACSTTPPRTSGDRVARPASSAPATSAIPSKKSGGGYYLDDGPGDSPPPNLDLVPDAVPRIEKFASGANRPYNVFGVDYVPDLSGAPYKQRGTGSWYGRKFHGQRTSSGEIYDMYGMTAAHPTLPIPCYALVTNLQNGKSVIVRVNDRGPFLHNRVMDLSYAAALKLGYLSSGSGSIEVEMLLPSDIAAGRIPVTTNSLYVAAATAGGARRDLGVGTAVASATPSVAAPAVVQQGPAVPTTVTTSPGSQAASGTSSPAAGPTLLAASSAGEAGSRPASYAERGIPPDLIPSDAATGDRVAATALPDTQPPARLPETVSSAGWFLQLGAFRAKAGADSFAAHVGREIEPALATRIHVVDGNGLYRVQVGPYARREEADGAATSLRAAVATPVLIRPEVGAR